MQIEGRNFCTLEAHFGVAEREACFVVRQHQNLPWEAVTELQYAGVSDDVEVWEQTVRLDNPETGETLMVRRLELRFADADPRWRPGDPCLDQSARRGSPAPGLVAGLYRKRWKIETPFPGVGVGVGGARTDAAGLSESGVVYLLRVVGRV